MSAGRLREAAALLRRRAKAATPGTWEVVGGGEYVQGPGIPVGGGISGVTTTDAEHIAMMQPPVALALADWLDLAADDHDAGCPSDCPATRVVDAILGGDR